MYMLVKVYSQVLSLHVTAVWLSRRNACGNSCISSPTHFQGGYNLTSISNSMAAIAGVLLGDPLPPLEGSLKPCQSALVSLQDAITAHLQHWSGLVPLDLEVMQQTKQPHPAPVPPSLPPREEKESARVDEGGENEGTEPGAVAGGPQGIQVPVGLTGQNRLVVEELENAGHVRAGDWSVSVSVVVYVRTYIRTVH